MIYQDSSGSINAFYKNRLIVSRPLKSLDRLKQNADSAIRDALISGWSLKKLKEFNFAFIKKLRYQEKVRIPGKEDWDIAMICVLILIKLRAIDPDGDREGLLLMKPKRVSGARRDL